MILSFHPIFEGDKNIICAGRAPDDGDLAAIKSARAVILPQGRNPALYEMARKNCRNVFPNFDARYRFPGKTGEIRLFRQFDARHPGSVVFADVAAFGREFDPEYGPLPFAFPFVFKFDWGGEGETVFLIKSRPRLLSILQRAAVYEKNGQRGFLFQEYIPIRRGTMRVVVIGKRFLSYWRIREDPESFCDSLAKGGRIDAEGEPELQRAAVRAVASLCEKSGVNLAGLDVVFPRRPRDAEPRFLEVNYFFGRRGLGGSEKYYEILTGEIQRWLQELGEK
ncbi:MAG: glutathione synthase [Desulfobacterales bacterium]|nr:glutathione synthase [Desulfobacterales bacterium]